MRKVIDTEFEYVSGPMRVGDEHPTQKGWYYTGRYNRRGVLLWYKPPGPISRGIRRGALILFWGMIAFGVVVSALFDG